MNKIPAHLNYPTITPVPETIPRPLWSVIIPTYNCADLLRETLKSVLPQDPGSDAMQIEIVDDVSTKDDPEAVVQELGKGRVSFFRQPQNAGPQANFTTCIQRAKGQLVHILHGDDTVLPGFYSRMQEIFDKEPTIGAAFCRASVIDEEGQLLRLTQLVSSTAGILPNWLERIAIVNQITFPSIVVRRRVYEELGGFHPELIHTSDWDMWKRIAVHHPVWYEPEPLAGYRVHTASDTSRLMRSGANVADIRRSIEISQSYLPTAIAAKLSNRAREQEAFTAFTTARGMLAKGDIVAAIAQIREALKCDHSFKVVRSMPLILAGLRDETLGNATVP